MKIKNPQDLIGGASLAGIGLAFAVGATQYDYGSASEPGPGYFPFYLGLILFVLGAITALIALARQDRKEGFGVVAIRPAAVFVISIGVFGFLLPRAGLLIAMPLLVLMVSFAAQRGTWREIAATAAVLTMGSWLVFVLGLGLPIPAFPTSLGT